METIDPKDVTPGDEVFVIYHNPHTPTVANIIPAEVVAHPKDPNRNALFLHETFHQIEDDDALFATEEAANHAFEHFFSIND